FLAHPYGYPQPGPLAADQPLYGSNGFLIASRFEDTVSHIVILAFLMSIVAGIGGNSGNQTMTMIIRAIATGRVTGSNVIPLIKRELLVTFLVGICGSAVTAFFAWFISEIGRAHV